MIPCNVCKWSVEVLVRRPYFVFLAVVSLCIATAFNVNPQQIDPKTYGGMKWRLVGPFRGGRVLTVAGVPSEPNTYYFGAVAGGVWKTTDGGNTWDPLFDKQGISSIGSIAISDSDPNVVFAGSGEACIRGNISFGDGVYKSTDQGKTWTNVGLKDTRHIGAVIIHPTNPDVVFIAALGHAYGPNTERGVFRTRDGGKTWEKVLYIDDHTGAIDVVFDPHNPHILFAAMWEGSRTPWSLNSGGDKSGSTVRATMAQHGSASKAMAFLKGRSAGSAWPLLEPIRISFMRSSKLRKAGSTVATTAARIGHSSATITASASAPGISRTSGPIPKTRASCTSPTRAFFVRLTAASPGNESTLRTGIITLLWIDPNNPSRMINGNDGGATISVDGGKNWTTLLNQPTAQFYHVVADNDFLYRVYGSQQDNTSIGIRTRSDHGAILQGDWDAVGGGESGYITVGIRATRISCTPMTKARF